MRTATTSFAALAVGVTAFAGFAGTAGASTRDNAMEVPSFSFGAAGGGEEPECWDWTNEDGTTGTECTAKVTVRWEKLTVPFR